MNSNSLSSAARETYVAAVCYSSDVQMFSSYSGWKKFVENEIVDRGILDLDASLFPAGFLVSLLVA